MLPLWKEHHAEVAPYPDIPLNPNLDLYEASERLGTLRIYTVRQGGHLVGYQIFFVSAHPHAMQSLQAVQDIVFLNKSHRKGLAGYRFLKWCNDELLKEKVEIVFQHISASHDFGRMLERLGYERVDLVYGLRLSPNA